MRITANIMNDNMLRNLQKNIKDLDGLNQQLASGKKFQRPSQAPIEVVNGMQYDSMLVNNDQYQSNVDSARSWISTTEDALASGQEVLQRGRELAIYGANGSLSEEDRKSIAEEVKELRNELITIANTELSGKYIFSGQATDKRAVVKNPDYTADPENEPFVNYDGDNNNINREISPRVKLTININVEEEVKTGNNDVKLFKDSIEYLNNLYNNLTDNNDDEISDRIAELGDSVDAFSAVRAKLGAKLNRLDMTESRLKKENLNLQELRSKNEDIDLAEVITNLKMEENIYRASLASGARVMQPTLVDFLQ